MAMWNQKGIFVAELTAAMAVGLLLLSALTPFCAAQVAAGRQTLCRIEAQQTARYALEVIAKDAKNCRRARVENRRFVVLERNDGGVIRYWAENGILRRESGAAGNYSGGQPLTGRGPVPTHTELEVSQTPDGLLLLELTVTAQQTADLKYRFFLQSAIMMQRR